MNYKEAIEKFTNEEYTHIQYELSSTETSRQEFVDLFPIDKIKYLDLDDYVVGKGKQSFCYWLETILKPLGSIKGGSTADKKFGVYYSKSQGKYLTISKWDKSKDVEKAFLNIKSEICNLLINGIKRILIV